MVTVEELGHRVRLAEAEIRSEKEISHAVLQQTVRNGAALNVLRSDAERVNADMVAAKSELISHGTVLTLLRQDVTAIRNDVTALRRGQEQLHVRMDRMETRFDTRLEAIESNVAMIERNVVAILAAVAPRDPA